jgi:hypothetical protein
MQNNCSREDAFTMPARVKKRRREKVRRDDECLAISISLV